MPAPAVSSGIVISATFDTSCNVIVDTSFILKYSIVKIWVM